MGVVSSPKAWEKESNQGSKRGSSQAFPSSFKPLPKLGYIFTSSKFRFHKYLFFYRAPLFM